MSRKTVRNLFVIVIIAVVLLSTMIIADFNYVLQKQKPVFCFIQNSYEDGGTIEYIGLGYKIIDYNAIYGRKDIVLGSIFKQYEPRVDESKFEDKVDNKNKIYNFSGKVEKIDMIDGKTILTVVLDTNIKQSVKVINSTLIYTNDKKSNLAP